MQSFHGAGVLSLLDEKNLGIEQKRRIISVSSVLDLIAVAVGPQGSAHKLAEKMQNFSKYVEVIESSLSK